MAGELSGILEHVDRISALDLDEVEPTSHVVALDNVLRADEPEPSLPARAGARAGARSRRRRLPRPLAPGQARMTELLELTRGRGDRPDRGRRARRRRVLRRLRARRRRATSSTPTCGAPSRARAGPAASRCAALPLAVKDLFCTEGIETTAGLADPRGLPAAVHGDRGPQARRRRRPPARQDQHGRVRDGLVERELRPTGRCQPVGSQPGPGRLLGRLGRGGRRAPRAVGDRHRHRRVDPPARVAVRDRRPEADLRRDLALRDGRLRLVARPVRPADPRRHRRGAAAARDGGPRPRDSTSVGIEGGVELPSREDLARASVRRRARLLPPRRGRRGRASPRSSSARWS